MGQAGKPKGYHGAIRKVKGRNGASRKTKKTTRARLSTFISVFIFYFKVHIRFSISVPVSRLHNIHANRVDLLVLKSSNKRGRVYYMWQVILALVYAMC